MNIYLRELRANLKSIIIWSICIILLVYMGLTEFASVKGTSSMSEMLETLPDSLKALMGGGAIDVDKAIGYYSVLFIYIELMITIHAAMIGAGIINKEERDKTVEFLMTRPVSRYYIISSKLLAAFTNILLLNIISFISSVLMFGSVSDEPIFGDLFKLTLGMFFLQIFFFTVGSVLASVKNNHKLSTGVSTGVLLTCFFLSIVVDLNKKLSFLKYFTPFRYFDAKTLLVDDGFNPFLILLVLVISTTLVILTYILYNKRDLGH